MARSTAEQTGGISIDSSGLRELATALRKTNRKAYTEYRKAARAAGEVTANVARAKIAEFSTTVPPTVKVRVAGAQVEIRGGSAQVPIGGLLELGNTHGRRSAPSGAKTFRHPLFGNWDYPQVQPMHPYLFPAFVETREAMLQALDGVFVEAFRQSGIEAS